MLLLSSGQRLFNEDADQSYTIGVRKATLYGTDETYLAQLADGMEEGAFPQSDQEVVLSSNAKLALDVEVGRFCDSSNTSRKCESYYIWL